MSTHPAPAPHPTAPDPTPLGGALPLRWKLPVLVSALVALSLVAVLALTYLTLRLREEETVRQRLEYAAAFVAGQAANGLRTRAEAMARVARNAAVRATLRRTRVAEGDAPLGAPVAVAPTPDDSAREAAAIRALDRMQPADSLSPVELWDARGRRVLGTGTPDATRALPPVTALAAATGDTAGGVFHGAFQAGPGGTTEYWTVTPVIDRGARIGYLATARRVNAPTQAIATLRALLSEGVTLSLRNVDGSRWLSGSTDAAAAPTERDSSERGVTYVRDGERRLVAEAPVEGTPWGIVMESPERWATERPRRIMRILALVGLFVTAAVGVVAWIAARRLARPLTTLTTAAEGVARGEYEHPVAGVGHDEVGRLATSFDAMARQVTTARQELERRAADAQAARAEAERARAEAERARAEAEHANRAKSDFLAVMSHELRTPLNAITGYAQLVELGVHGPVTPDQRDALARIGRSGTHLLGLINDVLSFARVDAGQVRYAIADVPLDAVLAEVEALVQPQARAAGVALVHVGDGAGAWARADHDKLRQVLLNLLANAVKYTPAGGTVTVSVDAADDVVLVRVRDTGVGIAAEKLATVFEPFVQGDRALNRPEEGVGLGLAIARDFARGMGGDVTAASVPGAGSTFTVTLPAVRAAATAAAATA